MVPIKHSTVNFIIPIFLTVMINHKTNVKKPRKDKLKYLVWKWEINAHFKRISNVECSPTAGN